MDIDLGNKNGINEISVFYIIPCLIAVFSSISFTAAVFCARMYTVEDIVRYSIRAAGAAVIYLLITGAFVKVLVRMSIRGIEERR